MTVMASEGKRVVFDGVQVFSATKAADRAEMSEVITEWIRGNPIDVVDRVVVQSSDSEFHCLSIVLFYTGTAKTAPRLFTSIRDRGDRRG